MGKLLEEKTAMETRVTVLGHLQRGGSPNATDRILAAQFAVHAVDLVADKKFGRIVIKKDGAIADMKYKSIARWQRKQITATNTTLRTARLTGICFGD